MVKYHEIATQERRPRGEEIGAVADACRFWSPQLAKGEMRRGLAKHAAWRRELTDSWANAEEGWLHRALDVWSDSYFVRQPTPSSSRTTIVQPLWSAHMRVPPASVRNGRNAAKPGPPGYQLGH